MEGKIKACGLSRYREERSDARTLNRKNVRSVRMVGVDALGASSPLSRNWENFSMMMVIGYRYLAMRRKQQL